MRWFFPFCRSGLFLAWRLFHIGPLYWEKEYTKTGTPQVPGRIRDEKTLPQVQRAILIIAPETNMIRLAPLENGSVSDTQIAKKGKVEITPISW